VKLELPLTAQLHKWATAFAEPRSAKAHASIIWNSPSLASPYPHGTQHCTRPLRCLTSIDTTGLPILHQVQLRASCPTAVPRGASNAQNAGRQSERMDLRSLPDRWMQIDASSTPSFLLGRVGLRIQVGDVDSSATDVSFQEKD
jgi:hypothetical protein